MLTVELDSYKIHFRNEKLHSDYTPQRFEINEYIIISFGFILESNWKENLDRILKVQNPYSEIDIVKKIQSQFNGDYAIFIISKYSFHFYGFTDILGRLPIYYHEKKESKEITFSTSPQITDIENGDLDTNSTLDFLIFGFQVEDSTIFKSVKKLSCYSFLNFERGELFTTEMNWPNWWIRPEYASIKELTKSIKENFKTIKNFINSQEEVIVDLSGGFDSRLVHALFAHQNNALFITQKYVQNEFKIASKLTLERNHKFLKTRHDLKKEEIAEVLKITDNLVNPYTSTICYKEQKEYLKVSKAKYRIMGFGGEFLRKPYKRIFFGKETMLKRCDFNPRKLNLNKSILQAYIKNRSTNLKSFGLKEFYYKYYVNLVVHAGEYRSRMDHVTIQPLYTKEVVAFFFLNNRSSFRLFYKILKIFEADLVVPIYKYGRLTYWKACQLDILKFLTDHYLSLRKRIIPLFVSRIVSKKRNNHLLSNLEPHEKIKPLFKRGQFDSEFYGKNYTDRLLGLNIFLHKIGENGR